MGLVRFSRCDWCSWRNRFGTCNGCGVAHACAIPLLATPASTVCINQAGACVAAAFIILHGWIPSLGRLLLDAAERCKGTPSFTPEEPPYPPGADIQTGYPRNLVHRCPECTASPDGWLDAFRARTTNVLTSIPNASVTDPKAAIPYLDANNSAKTSISSSFVWADYVRPVIS